LYQESSSISKIQVRYRFLPILHGKNIGLIWGPHISSHCPSLWDFGYVKPESIYDYNNFSNQGKHIGLVTVLVSRAVIWCLIFYPILFIFSIFQLEFRIDCRYSLSTIYSRIPFSTIRFSTNHTNPLEMCEKM